MVHPMARALCFLGGLTSIRGVRAAFVPRAEGVPVTVDKWETLALLEPMHRQAVAAEGFGWGDLWRAEQVHGDRVAVVPEGAGRGDRILPGVDGLLTEKEGVLLGIYVADCAAVYLADRKTGALGLVHSGKRGTEREIVVRAVEGLGREFGTRPEDLEAAISPCIRPPHYEVDFAADIERQLAECGVPGGQVARSGECTAAEVERYYSYRLEKGKTGRMLALLGRSGQPGVKS